MINFIFLVSVFIRKEYTLVDLIKRIGWLRRASPRSSHYLLLNVDLQCSLFRLELYSSISEVGISPNRSEAEKSILRKSRTILLKVDLCWYFFSDRLFPARWNDCAQFR